MTKRKDVSFATLQQQDYKRKQALREKNERLAQLAQQPAEQLYSIDDACDYLCLSQARIRGLIKAGKLSMTQVPVAGSKRLQMRIPADSLREFKQSRSKPAGIRQRIAELEDALRDLCPDHPLLQQ